MPRLMSFAMTTAAIENHEKTVTRRPGWRFLKVGDVLWAVDKCMGLKKGQSPERLAYIQVVSVRREPLRCITEEGCLREGFPELTPAEFVEKFIEFNGGDENTIVTRIEFRYLQAQI